MKGKIEDGRRGETGSTAVCLLVSFRDLALVFALCPLLPSSASSLQNPQLFRLNSAFFPFFVSSFSPYIFTWSTFPRLALSGRRMSPGFLDSLSLVCPLRFRHSAERTMERRYHNARQRVINNSACGFSRQSRARHPKHCRRRHCPRLRSSNRT